jgi:hypothetical protein
MSLACTFDGGRTWSDRPLVCTGVPCTQPLWVGTQYILLSDGAVLMTGFEPNSTYRNYRLGGLYRLPQGSAAWQYIGPLAGGSSAFFAPTSSGGVFWAYVGGYHLGRLSGIIGGLQSLPGVLFTATYS